MTVDPRPLPTSRQREIMQLVARGFSNKQIGRELNICEGTVKVHLHKIFSRLGVQKRTALVLVQMRSTRSTGLEAEAQHHGEGD